MKKDIKKDIQIFIVKIKFNSDRYFYILQKRRIINE